MNKIEFYCDICEFTSYLDKFTVDTLGFQVKCPECNITWDFRPEAIAKHKQHIARPLHIEEK